jgi:phage shock protein E
VHVSPEIDLDDVHTKKYKRLYSEFQQTLQHCSNPYLKEEWKMNSKRMLVMALTLSVVVIVIGLVALLRDDSSDVSSLPKPGLISPNEYQTKFADGDIEYYLLDVRTVDEFNSGHIEGADNIAVEVLDQYLSRLPTDRPIVLYCRTDNRSGQAAQILANAGFTDVYDIDGGIVEWTAQGFPLQ